MEDSKDNNNNINNIKTRYFAGKDEQKKHMSDSVYLEGETGYAFRGTTEGYSILSGIRKLIPMHVLLMDNIDTFTPQMLKTLQGTHTGGFYQTRVYSLEGLNVTLSEYVTRTQEMEPYGTKVIIVCKPEDSEKIYAQVGNKANVHVVSPIFDEEKQAKTELEIPESIRGKKNDITGHYKRGVYQQVLDYVSQNDENGQQIIAAITEENPKYEDPKELDYVSWQDDIVDALYLAPTRPSIGGFDHFEEYYMDRQQTQIRPEDVAKRVFPFPLTPDVFIDGPDSYFL